MTGSHAFKFGVIDSFGTRDVSLDSPGGVGLMYRFNNGVPNQLTEFATPYRTLATMDLQPWASTRRTSGRRSSRP